MTVDQLVPLALKQVRDLFNFGLRLSGRREEAEDLVQETFERSLRHADSFREPEAIRPMMFRILRNLFLDRRTAAERCPQLVAIESWDDLGQVPLAIGGSTPLGQLLSTGVSDEIKQALSRLPVEWRETLWLCAVEGFTYKETASITEVPIGTVRSRLSRARRALAKELRDHAVREGILRSPREEESS